MSDKLVIVGKVCSVGASLIVEAIRRSPDTRIFLVACQADDLIREKLNSFLQDSGCAGKFSLTWMALSDSGHLSEGYITEEDAKQIAGADFFVSPSYFNFSSPGLLLNEIFIRDLNSALELFFRVDGRHFHYLSSHICAGSWSSAWTEYDTQNDVEHTNIIGQYFSQAERLIKARFTSAAKASPLLDTFSIYRAHFIAGDADSGLVFDHDSLYMQILSLAARKNGKTSFSKATLHQFVAINAVAQFIMENISSANCVSGVLHVPGVYVRLGDMFSKKTLGSLGSKFRNRSRLYHSICERMSSYFGRQRPERVVGGIISDILYRELYVDDYRSQRLLNDALKQKLTPQSITQPKPFLSLNESREIAEFYRRIHRIRAFGDFAPKDKKILRLDGVEKAYWEFGEGENLLLLSGILGPESYFGLVNKLKNHFRIIVTDLLGAGPSEIQNDDVSLKRQVATLKSLIVELGCKGPISVVASDIYAPVISSFYDKFPSVIGKYIFLNPYFNKKNILINKIHNEIGKTDFNDKISKKKRVENIVMSPNVIHNSERLNYDRSQILYENIFSEKNSIERFASLMSDLSQNNSTVGLPKNSVVAWSVDNYFCDINAALKKHLRCHCCEPITFFDNASIDFYEADPERAAIFIFKNIFNAADNRSDSVELNHKESRPNAIPFDRAEIA